MHKLQNGSQVSVRPQRKPLVGLGGYFSESNDQGAPSYPGQDWFNDCTDEFINALDEMGITYDQEQLDHLARAFAAVRSQEWNANVNYGIGQEVVRNNLRYIARVVSGPDNGGAIDPYSASQSTWDVILPIAQSVPSPVGKWIKIVSYPDANTGWQSFDLKLIGGDWRGNTSTFFTCDVKVTRNQDVGSGSLVVTANPNGTHQPSSDVSHRVTLYTRKTGGVSELWVKAGTLANSRPLSVINYSHPASLDGAAYAAKAGILEVVSTEPTNLTLVPYDTGYQFASIPIGMEVAFDTPPPTNDPRFRFVRLTYNDAYNTGLLTSQTLSGSAPELVSTAVISAAQSPINGQTIDMINTMGTFIRPGVAAGVRQLSDNRSHNHTASGTAQEIAFLSPGPGRDFKNATVTTSASGGDEARPYNISRVFYKRIY
ncbi:TPA: hypothetical protein ACGG72_002829 [Vibrio cholerae]